MTKLTYANVQIDNLLSQVDSVLTVTHELLTDKTFSLEDRWELYLKIEKILPLDTSISESLEFLTSGGVHDVFDNGRGIRLNSDLQDWDFDVDLDAWKEMVLKEGTSGCVFDW